MAKPIIEGRVDKKFKKIKADFQIQDNGVILFRTEEETDFHPLAEVIKAFDDQFCLLSITNEIKYDSLEDDAKPIEE